jgi:hypothetical protein
VKLRYGDPPAFLDVSSVISQYQIQGSVSAGGTIGSPNDFANLGAAGAYIERPTITYTPLSGQKFVKSLLTPIPPSALLTLVQSGWPIDIIFRTTVRSINGIRNTATISMLAQQEDPEFDPLLQAMRSVQQSGALGIRLEKKGDADVVVMIIPPKFRDQNIEKRDFVRETLGLNKDADEFTLVFGLFPRNDREIAILSRSILEIMGEMTSGIQVPPSDIAEKRVRDFGPVAEPMVRIQSSEKNPEDSYVAVRYRKHWFSIDDRDFASKRAFAFLSLLLSLTETSPGVAPIVTVPTN